MRVHAAASRGITDNVRHKDRAGGGAETRFDCVGRAAGWKTKGFAAAGTASSWNKKRHQGRRGRRSDPTRKTGSLVAGRRLNERLLIGDEAAQRS